MTDQKRTVRAKFFVKSIQFLYNGNADEDQAAIVQMQPVFGNLAGNNNEEDVNSEWSKYTPQGELSMTINNPDAVEAFEVGKAYYLDFTPA